MREKIWGFCRSRVNYVIILKFVHTLKKTRFLVFEYRNLGLEKGKTLLERLHLGETEEKIEIIAMIKHWPWLFSTEDIIKKDKNYSSILYNTLVGQKNCSYFFISYDV